MSAIESVATLLPDAADLERRFGGLRRLYGDAGYARIRAARVAVVGLGGVGSWAGEALARSGVAALVLIDLDHVSESNINRQVQATGSTIGQAKALALRERIRDIHPGCDVHAVEEFADESNWPGLLPVPIDIVIDACDQVRAKLTLAAWALQVRAALISVGAAGGKRRAQEATVGDLANVTHDPLLAAVRNRLRRQHDAPRSGPIGVRCVYSREAVVAPAQICSIEGGSDSDTEYKPASDLSCHGYGSSVAVTASFGMLAASEALEFLVGRADRSGTQSSI
jgi:tRNA A37 threonylcarbamoyladenosine dehydratase